MPPHLKSSSYPPVIGECTLPVIFGKLPVTFGRLDGGTLCYGYVTDLAGQPLLRHSLDMASDHGCLVYHMILIPGCYINLHMYLYHVNRLKGWTLLHVTD